MRLPIVGGRLRGRWWDPTSRGKVLRILNGTYEREQTALFEQLIRPGHTVLDVGANIGYYTLLAAVLVGPKGAVHAFEPEPRNAGFLRRHVEMNRLRKVTVQQAAVSDRAGTARFDFGSGSGTGRLADSGAIEVRTLRLDDYCAEHGLAPSAIKIDVEGAEMSVLQGARQTLERHRPVLFLSTHGAEVHRACLAFLRGLGYGVRPILGGDVETTSEVLATPGGA
ncbi:FkbM family methyltransferase [Longimicrobium sp.]|uniref:FkbM family methyltransferase n=1 Tax=Longimicrobium sp. TaxID=2029185 RepID=UPI002E3052C3|nr:FkbM family methyltransferase [Longimicrobium sp.]HEX6042077.1 FkbM family methyltransferase [Longimicrobium sp.]